MFLYCYGYSFFEVISLFWKFFPLAFPFGFTVWSPKGQEFLRALLVHSPTQRLSSQAVGSEAGEGLQQPKISQQMHENS